MTGPFPYLGDSAMTVGELIEKLKAFPPDLPVWVDGDRGSYQYGPSGPELGHTVAFNGCEEQVGWLPDQGDYLDTWEPHELTFRACVVL